MNEISARSCKDLENRGAYLTDKVPNSKNSNEFDNFNMKKKKNLSNPTVELSYQLNILNLNRTKDQDQDRDGTNDKILQKKRTKRLDTCVHSP